jgi:2-aminoethylphosphonate-pyruvate transaminase
VPPPEQGGRLLVLANGAYGERLAAMAGKAGIACEIARVGETEAWTAAEAEKHVAGGGYSHVAMVHHETTAGVLNPIREVGAVVREHLPGASFFVDSMSAFGAYDVDMERDHVDYLVSSANKNIEGVPGFSFAICNRALLERDGVHARTVTLDLLEQLKGLESNGQFRFTPPTHALLAFDQALAEHAAEGGVAARLARYQRNCDVLLSGMAEMGFAAYVPDAHRGCVINTFVFPDDANFDFTKFYEGLAKRGMVIYPGKLTGMDCFRIGSIGRLYESDMSALVGAVRDVLEEMEVALPVTQMAVEC